MATMMRVLAALVLWLAVAAPQGSQEDVARALPAPHYLSPTARAVLKRRMQRHGRDLIRLGSAVVLLDFEHAGKLAELIAEDAQLARPLTGDATELNNQLPEPFFVLQDELRA